MEHAYNLTLIVITTWASLDRNGSTPEVRIAKKLPLILQTMRLNNAFPTKEEAEKFALGVAKKWIDEINSKHSPAAIKSTVDATSNRPLR